MLAPSARAMCRPQRRQHQTERVMKRKIALLVLIILAVGVLLVACNSTEKTSVAIRWDDEEKTYRVALADFAGDDGAIFKEYKDNEGGSEKSYYKDYFLNGENLNNLDEIRPRAVDGTYTTSLKKRGDTWTYETDQVLYLQYDKELLEQSVEPLSEGDLAKITATAEEVAQLSFENAEGCIILKSSTKTSVTFEDTIDQKPQKSETTVNGFYVGKAHQQLTNYTVATEYDFSNAKKPIAKVTLDGNTVEHKLPRNTTAIDANQILLYLRSLNKSQTSFQDNPAVQVFNSFSGELQVARFGMEYQSLAVLTFKDEEKHCAVNSVAVTIDGLPFMHQFNLPDNLKLGDKDLDKMLSGAGEGTPESKFTTVRFRVGYLSYELEQYPQECWDALVKSFDAES